MTVQVENSLGRRAFTSTLWAAAGRAGRAASQVIFMLALGRAVGPSGFAAASIALIGFQLVSTVAAQSFAQALVRYPEEDAARNATAFWLNAAFSIGLALAIWAVSGSVADMLALPDLLWLLPLTTALALPIAPTAIAQARLSKMMDFRYVALVETIASVAATVAAIGALILDMQLGALVVFAGTQRLVELLGFLRIGHSLPQHVPALEPARELLDFTMPLMVLHVLTFANTSIDQFFVGQANDPTRLGLFSLGRRLTQQPTQMISFAIERAIFPAFAHARNSSQGQHGLFLQAIRLSVLASSLPLFLLAVVATDFVTLVLGAEWAPAGAYIALFSIGSAVLPVGGVFTAALRAEGRTRTQVLYQLIRLALTVSTLGLLAYFEAGLWAMAVAVVVITVTSLALPWCEISLCFGISQRRMATELVLGLAPAVVMYATMLGLEAMWLRGLPGIARFTAEIGLGSAISVLVVIPTIRNLRPGRREKL